MGAIKYFCRIIPGLSILIWSTVCWMALSGRLALPWSDKSNAKTDWHNLDIWQVMYIVYSILAHISACLVFPVRLCYSVFQLTNEVRSAKFEAIEIISRQYDTQSETSASSIDDKSSNLSIPISNASTLAGTPESSLSRIGTPKLGYFDELESLVTHAIILPAYKEDMGTLRETMLVLSSHPMAKSSYDIYLAMEKRDPNGVSTAKVLIEQFQHSFKKLGFTLHPDDIVGEVAGKSSNVSWAAKTLSHNYSDPLERRNTIITVMDSDTHFPASYFLLMTKAHRENPNSDMSLYTCPLCFDRNSHQVNPLVRTADIFWCGAGLSGMYRGSSVKIPTSVYSVAMPLAGRIGGWDTGPESIGEDMHTYLKAYFATKGKAETTIIFTPASQCNVSTDVKGVRGFFSGVWARYQQALRHMWGCLDTGFAVHKGLECIFKVESNNATWLSDPEPEARLDRWMEGVEHFSPPNLNLYDEPEPTSFNKIRMALLYHRLYEAHFLPAHLTVALFSAVIYSSWVPSAVTHPVLLSAFSFCGTLRAIGMLLTCFYLYLYESYHKLCVKYREDEMKKAGLYEDMKAADGFSHREWRSNWMDYLCLPATGMLFGTIPAVVAYLRHFYTDNLLYTVSAKPQVQMQKVADKLHAVADKVASAADQVAERVNLDKIIESVA